MVNREAIIKFLQQNCIGCKKLIVAFQDDRITFFCDNNWGQFSEDVDHPICTQKEPPKQKHYVVYDGRNKCQKCGNPFIAIPSCFKYCPDCMEKMGLICSKCGKWDCKCQEESK